MNTAVMSKYTRERWDWGKLEVQILSEKGGNSMNHLSGISAHVLTKCWFPGEMWLYFICVTVETLIPFQWQDHCICVLYSCQYSAFEILINMTFTKYLEFLGSKVWYKHHCRVSWNRKLFVSEDKKKVSIT